VLERYRHREQRCAEAGSSDTAPATAATGAWCLGVRCSRLERARTALSRRLRRRSRRMVDASRVLMGAVSVQHSGADDWSVRRGPDAATLRTPDHVSPGLRLWGRAVRHVALLRRSMDVRSGRLGAIAPVRVPRFLGTPDASGASVWAPSLEIR
jgi:hypothetical protein